MKNDRIAKRVYLGECVGSCLVDQLWKRIDQVNDCLKKGGLNVLQPRGMIYDRNEWWDFVKGNAWVMAQGINP